MLAAWAAAVPAQVVLTRGTNFAVDIDPDGERLAIDLLGRAWALPARGGAAEPLTGVAETVRRPRWSPDGEHIVYQVQTDGRQRLGLLDVTSGALRTLGNGAFYDQHPAWHPDGERIVFSSKRDDTGFDLWERDVPTGLAWRLTHAPGDETEPAWSADGRDLVFIHQAQGTWSVVLRRRGEPDRVLESAPTRLSSPAWRPDGSLVTFLRHAEAEFSIDMIILSEPLVIRPLVAGEDFFVAPVSWLDRHRFLYTAGGHIRARDFDAWTSANVPFRATIEPAEKKPAAPVATRPLPKSAAAPGRVVVRVGRLFDGLSPDYRQAVDILVDDGRITAIEPHGDRAGEVLVDLGDLTAIPGLVDARAALPDEVPPALGALLLSFGVTTIATDHPEAAALDAAWAGKATPGPRVLGSDWLRDFEAAPSLVIDHDALPVSPLGVRYEDFRLDVTAKPATVISGLADRGTVGLPLLMDSRQAELLAPYAGEIRHHVDKPRLTDAAPAVILGSAPNGLPPGIAQHAELRALVAAGLAPRRAPESAGAGAGAAPGAGLALGRIGPSAVADILIVDGDPLADIAAVHRVVAVISRGRFFSAIGLIERAQAAPVVEEIDRPPGTGAVGAD
ncbi:MAG: hypothetical protein R3176_07355 [Woeseiaceae bacterium]|nr:hypothetical protein [Woeseiaceae bacterium]